MGLVEMMLVMHGRKLLLHVTLGGSDIKEWQLYADTKLVHFQNAQERILEVSSCWQSGLRMPRVFQVSAAVSQPSEPC